MLSAKAKCVRLERELEDALAEAGEMRAQVASMASGWQADWDQVLAERDAALAVIAEVREALAPGRPLYAALGAARAALEKVAG